MSPEWMDDTGIKHWFDPEVGVFKNREFSPNCQFFDEYRRVKMNWPGTHNNGREGWWVGVDPAIGEKGVPYQIVVWDSGELSMIHDRWLIVT